MYEIGQAIYFKLDGMQRKRKGVVIGGNHAEGWQVQGRRTLSQPVNYPGDIFNVPSSSIQTVEQHIASLQPTGIYEATSTFGRSITAEEQNRRAQVATERLQMSEHQLLQARALLEIRRRAVRKLAYQNKIASTINNYDFEELNAEYIFAQLKALRATAATATDNDIREFEQYLTGETTYSRIILSITRSAKTAAIRYLKKRAEYHLHHHNLDDYAYRLAA